MRSPLLALFWLLTVMTSSSMAAMIEVVNECPSDAGTTCTSTEQKQTANGNEISCAPGYVLESTVLENPLSPFLLKDGAKLKTGCYSKCHVKYNNNNCPGGITGCKEAERTAGKLECPGPGKEVLVVNGVELMSSLVCNKIIGWKTAADGPTVVDFTKGHHIVSFCKPAVPCTDLFEAVCPSSDPCTAAQKPIFTDPNLLKCTSGFLVVDKVLYNEATCSDEGWKADGKLLLAYMTKPAHAKLVASCLPHCDKSMVEDNCAGDKCISGEFKPVTITATTNKLTCPANYYLMIDEKVIEKDVTCSSDGWKVADATAKLVDYSTKIEKLKANCISKCNARFVDRIGADPSSRPIYINEGEPLFCRGANEQLILNGKEVADVECDITKLEGGWRAVGGTDLVVPFTAYSSHSVQAECKQKPGAPTPAPPIIYGTTTEGSPTEAARGSTIPFGSTESIVYISVIVALLVIIFAGIGLFFWVIHRKKRAGNEDDHSKTTNSKDSKKKCVTVKECDVEVPEHQMSTATSGSGALTAALVSNINTPPPNNNPVNV